MKDLIKNIKTIINRNHKIMCPKCNSENIKLFNKFDEKNIVNYIMQCNNCENNFMIELIKNSEDNERIDELLYELQENTDTL